MLFFVIFKSVFPLILVSYSQCSSLFLTENDKNQSVKPNLVGQSLTTETNQNTPYETR